MNISKNQGLRCGCKLFNFENEQEGYIDYHKSNNQSIKSSNRMLSSVEYKKKSLKKYSQNTSASKLEKNQRNLKNEVFIAVNDRIIEKCQQKKYIQILSIFAPNKNNNKISSTETQATAQRKSYPQLNIAKITFNKPKNTIQSKSFFFDSNIKNLNYPGKNFVFQRPNQNYQKRKNCHQNKIFKNLGKKSKQQSHSQYNQQSSFSISYPTNQFWKIIQNNLENQ